MPGQWGRWARGCRDSAAARRPLLVVGECWPVLGYPVFDVGSEPDAADIEFVERCREVGPGDQLLGARAADTEATADRVLAVLQAQLAR